MKFDSIDSAAFWEERYAEGGSSGDGSRGDLGRFKASYLNGFVSDHKVEEVIEFGCGEGVQLELADYPRYLGLDVSQTAIEACRRRFPKPAWTFHTLPSSGRHIGYDLALSLDVIYHLIEDEVYERHMQDVFTASMRYVILYTTDWPTTERTDVHVLHRPVTSYVADHFVEWQMIEKVTNPWPPDSDFFAYERVS